MSHNLIGTTVFNSFVSPTGNNSFQHNYVIMLRLNDRLTKYGFDLLIKDENISFCIN